MLKKNKIKTILYFTHKYTDINAIAVCYDVASRLLLVLSVPMRVAF